MPTFYKTLRKCFIVICLVSLLCYTVIFLGMGHTRALNHSVVFVQLCSSWQDFRWHSAWRSPSEVAELLVHPGRFYSTLLDMVFPALLLYFHPKIGTFSVCDLELWPPTLTYKLDLNKAKMNHYVNKAIVDIRLRPQCAIPHSRTIIDSLAIKRRPLLCASRCMDQSNSQFIWALGLSVRFSPETALPFGIITPT